MRRNKIKNKYLKTILINGYIEDAKDNSRIVVNILTSIGLIILMLIWNSVPAIFMSMLGIDYNNLSLIYKVIYLFICDISLILLLLFIYRKDVINNFKSFFNKKFFSNIEVSLRYWGIGLTVMLISNIIIGFINSGDTSANEEAVRNLIDIAPLFMTFELIIYAPIVEELIFRKSIRNITNNKIIYALTSGIIFGAMHVLGSVVSILDLLFLIPYSALGIAFALLYYKTNNIFSSISVHAMHNSLSLVLYLLGSM